MNKSALLFLLASATASYADCVTERTLAKDGVRVVWDDGATSVFTKAADTLVIENYTYADGYKAINFLAQGAFLVSSDSSRTGVFTNQNRIDVEHAVSPNDMPKPSVNSQWQTEATVYVWDGGNSPDQETRQSMHFSWGSEETITLGPCSYQIIPGTLTVTRNDEEYSEYFEYLTVPGIALWVGESKTGQAEPDRWQWVNLEANK